MPIPPYVAAPGQPAPPDPSTGTAAVRQTAGRRLGGCLFEIVETLVLTLLIFLGIQTFVAQPYQVKQQSMQHTLEQGQYVLVDKLSPRWEDYRRGDIVVFHPPEAFAGGDDTPFIKRVIGIGDDTVEIDEDGIVRVNGRPLDESYLLGAPPTDATCGSERWVVPQGEYFVMGDHRNNSADSRCFGTIRHDQIVGRAWLRYWPLDTFGILPAAHPYPGNTAGAPAPSVAPRAAAVR